MKKLSLKSFKLQALDKLKFSLFLLMFLSTTSSLFSQASGISIGWDINVGCQVYTEENKERQDPLFVENFVPGVCVTVCENSTINYSLTGNFATTPLTTWSINGGIINSSVFNNANVTWGAAGAATLTFTTLTPSGPITKTICFTKVVLPTAAFNSLPAVAGQDEIYACANQTVYFTNSSSTNGGSGLYSYLWDFGDGTPTSAAFAPTHVYRTPNIYLIQLTVINSCGCKSITERKIRIDSNGIEISCPSIVCDGQSAQYSIPVATAAQCSNPDWTIVGGTINSQANGLVNVTWDNVDATGFGLITFNPASCLVTCPFPTTAKIPVIKAVGTIIGNSVICFGGQDRYVLPQWPTTDFVWSIVDATPGNPIATIIHTGQRNEIIINPLVTGIITLQCNYTNTLLHCGGTATFNINVIQPLTINGPTRLCKNSLGSYAIGGGQSTAWTLTSSNGTILSSSTFSDTFSYSFVNAGNYQLNLGSSASPQCPNSTLNIEVIDLPQIVTTAIVGDRLGICPTVPYTYTIQNPAYLTEYVWSVPAGGTFDGPSIGNTVTIRFDAATSHQVSVFNRTLAPLTCVSPTTTITINTLTIPAQITDGLSLTVCPNSTPTYQINSTAVGTPLYTLGDNYTWTITPANLGSVTANQGTNTATIQWNNVTVATPATLSVVVNKCTVSTTLTKAITISPVPVIDLKATNSLGAVVTNICSGSPVTFTVSALNNFALLPNTTVNWNFGNGVVQNTNGLSVTYQYANLSAVNATFTITATLVNPNGCFGTTIKTVNLVVNPGPVAINSLSSGGNSYCPGDPINTVLTATSSTTGATFKWYKVGSPTVLLGITNQLTINNNNASLGFGSYYFIATNAAGCQTNSDAIQIIELNCVPPTFCTVSPNPVVTNTSSIVYVTPGSCPSRRVNLTGITTPAPFSVKWDVFGPGGFGLSDFTGTFFPPAGTVLEPGEYTIIKKVVFVCTNGQLANETPKVKKVTIPYYANFSKGVICNGSNSYTVSLIDTSPFFSPVTARTYTWSRSLTQFGVYSVISNSQNFNQTGVPAGNYWYKLAISGTLLGVAQPICEKVINVTIIPQLNLTITPPTAACHDTAVAFSLSQLSLPGFTFLWTFDTGASSTLQSPKRVFTNSGIQSATCMVTDPYGCTQFLTAPAFAVPAKCFNGAIAASSSNPVNVCLGSPFNLQYVPSAGECPATSYTWMNGATAIGNTATGNFNVTTPGVYWVKVRSANNCIYPTPQRITPAFKPLPPLTMVALGAICNTSATANIVTTATIISWQLDSNPAVANNATSFSMNNLSVGNHTLTATVTGAVADGSCSNTRTQTFTVATPPVPPVITVERISCEPYRIKLTATNPAVGSYNWTNGENGASITVTSGGPYGVTFTSNGCSSFAQTDVPQNAEIYLWSFPKGCYTGCAANNDVVIGPQLPPSHNWQWLLGGNPVGQGYGFVAPLTLTQSGEYSFNINNGLCDNSVGIMDYTSQNCRECEIKLIVKDQQIIDERLCINRVYFSIDNYSGSTITATITNPDGQVLVVPSGITLLSGQNVYAVDFIPLNGFQGGNITIVLTAINGGKSCASSFVIKILGCRQARSANKSLSPDQQFLISDLTLAPNPAKNSTTITFSNAITAPLLEVYDVLGKVISSHQASNTNDSWVLDTSKMAAGVYIVALKLEGIVVMQKKLVIE